jgi:hypothetical protein
LLSKLSPVACIVGVVIDVLLYFYPSGVSILLGIIFRIQIIPLRCKKLSICGEEMVA